MKQLPNVSKDLKTMFMGDQIDSKLMNYLKGGEGDEAGNQGSDPPLK